MDSEDKRRLRVVTLVATLAVALGGVAVVLLPDGVVTVGLFVVLSPVAVLAAGGFGAFMIMLGDAAPKSPVSIAAILLAVVGPVLGTVAFLVVAAVVASGSAGTTFHLPLVAVAASVVWSLGLCLAAVGLIRVFR